MSLYDRYITDNHSLQQSFNNDKSIKSISAIKSCIEADEATLLLEAVKDNYNAKIYALICCFTLIPSVKCIERLIAEGTPLDKSFNANPFNCTPQEYLDKHFGFTSNKLHTKSRSSIYQAIDKGKKINKNKEHISINVYTPTTNDRPSTFKKISNILSPLLKK